MTYSTNSSNFISAADNSADDLIKAYCGLVAIELALKREISLSSHNIPTGMDSFKNQKLLPASPLIGQLTNLRLKLIHDLAAIHVQDKNGCAISAPSKSYPYIRYTRIQGDGWGTPETPPNLVTTLADTVGQIRSFFRSNFGLSI